MKLKCKYWDENKLYGFLETTEERFKGRDIYFNRKNLIGNTPQKGSWMEVDDNKIIKTERGFQALSVMLIPDEV